MMTPEGFCKVPRAEKSIYLPHQDTVDIGFVGLWFAQKFQQKKRRPIENRDTEKWGKGQKTKQ